MLGKDCQKHLYNVTECLKTTSNKVDILIFILDTAQQLANRICTICRQTRATAMKQVTAFPILKLEEKVKLDFLVGQNLI